jgi:MoxR-like ATPase
MLLDTLGLVGWHDIEPTILSALTNSFPILFVGRHGTAKTDGAEFIAKALVGEQCRFRKYDVPLINTDDLLGFPNPKSLQEGRVQYLETPLTIWGADAALFDEINRASPFVAAKIMEIVRTKRAMGMETQLKVVFAAMNPPDDYDAIYMDLATCSRFIIVQVPGSREMKKAEMRMILQSDLKHPEETTLRDAIKAARELLASFGKNQSKSVDNIVLDIMKAIDKKALCIYSPRQVKNLRKMLLAAEALRQHLELPEYNITQLTHLVTSTIPETFSITRQRVERTAIEGPINTIIAGFRLGDVTITSKDLKQLVEANDMDKLAWAARVKSVVSRELSKTKIITAGRTLLSRYKKGDLDRDMTNSLLIACMQSYGKSNMRLKWKKLEFQPFVLSTLMEAVADEFKKEINR